MFSGLKEEKLRILLINISEKYELVTNVCFNDDKSAKALLKHSQSIPSTIPEALPQVFLKHSQTTTKFSNVVIQTKIKGL